MAGTWASWWLCTHKKASSRKYSAHPQHCIQLHAAWVTGEGNTPLKKINANSKTLTIHQGKSETRKCFIGKVQKKPVTAAKFTAINYVVAVKRK